MTLDQLLQQYEQGASQLRAVVSQARPDQLTLQLGRDYLLTDAEAPTALQPPLFCCRQTD